MGLKIKIFILLLLLFALHRTGYAAWTGPVEVLSGSWGSNPGQFGINYDDTADTFPKTICISSSGNIVIADENNSRVQTFKPDGTSIAAFGPQNIPDSEGWRLGWPLRLGCLSSSIYTEFDKYTQIYSFSGSLMKSWDNLQGGLLAILQDDNFVTETSTAYYFYSPNGQLIKTSNTKLSELGKVKAQTVGPNQYRHTIEYPTKIYSFVIPWPTLNAFARDNADNLIVSAQTNVNDAVYKISPCGKILGQFYIPDTKSHIKKYRLMAL